MSMPGYVYYLRCLACAKCSQEYSLYVFPNLYDDQIMLPAWSRQLRCYSKLFCLLEPGSRSALEQNHARLRELTAQLSSAAMTVGFPVWSIQSSGIQVEVVPAPVCPSCGHEVEALAGYPPIELFEPPGDVSEPYAVPIPMLCLSVRALNALEEAGIANLGQLCERSADELLALRHFGETTLREVQSRVALTGHKLREP